MKLAMINIYNELPKEAKLILQVHDEVLIELPEEIVDKVTTIVKNCMENAVELDVPLKVDVTVGKSWQK